MNKYVSFRLEKSNLVKVVNQYNHDTRRHSPKYINASKSSENITLFVSDRFKALRDKDLKPKALFESYNEEQRIRIKEKTNRKAQASAEFFNSAIMTFSPTMAEDYKKNPELFKKCSLVFLESLKEKYGINIMESIIHLDESNPHIHLTIDNIGENGKGVRRTITPNKLSDIQTLMGKSFEPMGYERGESRKITNRKHLTVRELHGVDDIYNQLNDDIKSLEEEKEIKQNIIKLLGDESPKMAYIVDWIKGEVPFAKLSNIEQEEVIKFLVPKKNKNKGMQR